MPANVTNRFVLSSLEDKVLTTKATALISEAGLIIGNTGAPVVDGTLGKYVAGISAQSAQPGEYFPLVTETIAVVLVTPGQVIAERAQISADNAGKGTARVGVPGTDEIIGYSLDSSDGSGTLAKPHFVRVVLK